MSEQGSNHPRVSRRLLGAGALGATGALALGAATPAQATGAGAGHRRPKPLRGTNLVLLGTAGGPPWWDGGGRSGVSSAVTVGEAVYLIDCGEGWGPQYRAAGLGPSGYQHGIDNLQAVFLTHLHSDHISDYGNLLTLAWHNGADHLKHPIHVYGPGNRGELPPVFGGGEAPEVASPQSPTPGTVEMTQRLYDAFATDLNDRIRDYHKPELNKLFVAHDIELPAGVGDDPNGNPHPAMEPFEVYSDDRVKVSAILVQHAPVFPAFAFRFDTDEGSIVISGDTGPSDNLVKLATGADILVHECIDGDWVRDQFPANPTQAQEGLMHHLLAAHTEIHQVGPLAERAGVGTLVLNHLAPGFADRARWRRARRGFSGRFVVGEDLMRIRVGRH